MAKDKPGKEAKKQGLSVLEKRKKKQEKQAAKGK